LKQREAITMQRWDYRVARFQRARVDDAAERPGRRRDVSPEQEADFLLETLKQSGEQGWELVAVMPRPNDEYMLIFKQPRP
jgi:hypothetical protein